MAIDICNGMIATNKVAPKYRETKVFEYLAPEYQTWLYQSNRMPPPEKTSPLDDNADRFAIVHPRQGDVFVFEPGYDPGTQSIELKALVNVVEEKLYWFVNGEIHEQARWPYRASLPMVPGKYSISFGSLNDRCKPVSITVR